MRSERNHIECAGAGYHSHGMSGSKWLLMTASKSRANSRAASAFWMWKTATLSIVPGLPPSARHEMPDTHHQVEITSHYDGGLRSKRGSSIPSRCPSALRSY